MSVCCVLKNLPRVLSANNAPAQHLHNSMGKMARTGKPGKNKLTSNKNCLTLQTATPADNFCEYDKNLTKPVEVVPETMLRGLKCHGQINLDRTDFKSNKNHIILK